MIEQCKWFLWLAIFLLIDGSTNLAVSGQEKKTAVALSMRAAQVDQEPSKDDWQRHMPKRGFWRQYVEVASISRSHITVKTDVGDNEETKIELVKYSITSRTKFYDTEDRRLTWKAIKRGDHVDVISDVHQKVALMVIRVS